MKIRKLWYKIIIIICLIVLSFLLGIGIGQVKNVVDEKEKNKIQLNGIFKYGEKDYIEQINKIAQAEYVVEKLEFELPIEGATGYAPIKTDLKESNTKESTTKFAINKGEAFTILKEKENWWYVSYNKQKGWVENTLCMINLPDIVPSIIYEDTNAKSSIFKSSNYNLPNITGKKLYEAITYNERFEKQTYNMPVVYQMAKKICVAQKKALENGESLKIYETYRPYEVQRKVAVSLKQLMDNNENVYNGINTGNWNESWFIAQSLSNHQLGVAMDVSLVKITNKIEKVMGKYSYIEITEYKECKMPTQMHELSAKAATFKNGVSSASKTDWKKVALATTMTEDAIKLQNYCTSAGLSPLASEWWHFNDLDARSTVKGKKFDGRFYLKDSVSIKTQN